MRARARRSIILTGGAVAAATGVVSGPAHATVDAVEVTNTLDEITMTGPVAGSLRWALEQANTDPDLTTITFASGVTGTITLTAGPLLVESAVDIVGPGVDVLRVDGGGLSGVFAFYGQAYDGDSTISDITISGGATGGQSIFGTGSGVLGINSHLTLDSVVVEQNAASAGGGVLLIGDDVQFLATGSTIRDNTISNELYLPFFGGAGIAFLSFSTPGIDQPGRVPLAELVLPPAPGDSHVTLVDSTVSGNSGALLGGGVLTFGFGGTLTLDHSTVSGNSAQAGGGIAAYGYVTTEIVDSTISGNSATQPAEAESGIRGIGGGILAFDLYAPAPTATSTVVQARSPLAALAEATRTSRAEASSVAFYDASFSIENTTISGNTADAFGGGLMVIDVSCVCDDETPSRFSVDEGGSTTVSNTIIGGNSAPDDPDVSVLTGFTEPASSTAGATTASGERSIDQSAMYSFGAFSADYSIIGAVDADGTQATGTGLLFGDPVLSPLADNGGPTLTHLPLTGSPAIDAGDPAFVAPPADDQRHGSRVVNGALDIGAVEVVPGPVDDSYSTPEDTPLVIAANGVLGNDPDAPNLSAAVTTGPSHGTLALSADGSFTYTPNADYNGPDSFTYTTTGLFGVTGTATVTIAVTPVNDPPVAVDDSSVATQGGPAVGINVLANDSDPDGDTLSVTGTSGGAGSASLVAGRSPAHGLVSFTPTSVVYTPTATFVGTDSFTYTITDGALTATATVTVVVNAAETAAAPPATAAPTMPPPVELPSTGQPADNSVELATATLGAGLALTLIGRRRRKSLRKA